MMKTLIQVETPIEADLIVSFLESQSIRVYTEHSTINSILPIGGGIGTVLKVHESQFERAKTLLVDFLNSRK